VKPISRFDMTNCPESTYTLHEAERGGHAAFVAAQGDGSTAYLRLTIRNLRDYPLRILIRSGTSFEPQDTSYQEMTVIRSASLSLGPLQTRTIWVNTACLQADRNAPQSAFNLANVCLREIGLGESQIAEIIAGNEDSLEVRLDDLDRIGQRLGYTAGKMQELREVLNFLSSANWGHHMGYRLCPVSPQSARELSSITRTVEDMDQQIARISAVADEYAAELIQKYGRKKVIEELTKRGTSLKDFGASQYLEHLDIGLARNVFRDSGRSFAVGEACTLVEFDAYNDPKGFSDPRLSSLVVQYAIWSLTDGFGWEECCEKIKRVGAPAQILAAGVRSLLRRSERIREEGAHLGRKAGLFAASAFRRRLARRLGF
jgi:hypothetical protein